MSVHDPISKGFESPAMEEASKELKALAGEDDFINIASAFKEDPIEEELSFWDRSKENWNRRWQDPETRQGMFDIGVKGLQGLITAPSRTRAAIGDIYTKTRMGQPSRSLDVLAETAEPDLYSQLRALEGKKKARLETESRKDRWNRLLNLGIEEREAKVAKLKAEAAAKKD